MRQSSTIQRRLAAGAFLLLAAPVALGSVAYACQSLATAHANPQATNPGATVTLFGRGYQSGATNSAIEVHLDGRTGRLLASFTPRSVIDNQPVVIPGDIAVGTHTLVVTQYTSAGNMISGGPGRASISVTAAARTSSEDSGTGAATTAAVDPTAAPEVAPVTPTAATPATETAKASIAAPTAPAAAGTVTQSVVVPAASAAVANDVAATAADRSAAAGAAASTGGPAAPAAAAAAAAEQTAATAGPASVSVGLLPASSSGSSTAVPGLALAAGLALVLLALGAFIKSGRNMLGHSSTPLAG